MGLLDVTMPRINQDARRFCRRISGNVFADTRDHGGICAIVRAFP